MPDVGQLASQLSDVWINADMDYNKISNFLDKFKKLLSHSEACYKIIAETISKHISITIEEKNIKIKGTTIFINGSPILKNEILIHKQGILTNLKEFLPGRNFTDIR
jgi:hypothetical protein